MKNFLIDLILMIGVCLFIGWFFMFPFIDWAVKFW